MPARPKPGSKADRDALRTEMLTAGATRNAIVAEMRARWGLRPREAWRQAHGWSLQQAADRINDASNGSALAALIDASQLGKWEKWPAPASRRPSLAVIALLAEVYGCVVEDLLDLEDRRHLPDTDLRVLRGTTPPQTPDRAPSPQPGRTPEPAGPELVLLTADQSASWAQWAEGSNVGDIALEQFLADVRALAGDYLIQDPMTLFMRTRRLRDRVFTLLEGHQPPRQTTNLYVAAGYLCGLLAWASSDLGQLHAADTQGRTAWLCAELAGHDGLRAWVLSTRSKIAFWDRRYRDAINHARRGATFTVPGTAGILLSCQEADAWAELGATDEAGVALTRAETAREKMAGTDEIGGIFSCGAVRHANYSSAVHLRAGQPHEALVEADGALGLLAQQSVRAVGTEAQLHLVRATALLVTGEADGAFEALLPVLGLRPEQRLDTVTCRLEQFAARVAQGSYAGSGPALEIQGAVEVYCRESAPRIALSPSPAGPAWITGHD
ncbi:helix-turn-helix transcriptional regulator [Streptacidiphilus sp. EB129]|uniref:helix-turn-helix transcriptional regulator n=1 Tax=Streptacidiphilus sp. EB129 TaxID=3156262 RepID=UPI00351623EC